MTFLIGGCLLFLRDVVRIYILSFLSLYYIIPLYTSLVTIFLITYIVLFSHLYMMMCVIIHLSLHMLFLFSLYTHVSLLYAILYFYFTLRCLDEFCLSVSER